MPCRSNQTSNAILQIHGRTIKEREAVIGLRCSAGRARAVPDEYDVRFDVDGSDCALLGNRVGMPCRVVDSAADERMIEINRHHATSPFFPASGLPMMLVYLWTMVAPPSQRSARGGAGRC